MLRIASVEFARTAWTQAVCAVKAGEIESIFILVVSDERCSALCSWPEACSVSTVPWETRPWWSRLSRGTLPWCVLARKVGGKQQQLCKDGCALCCAVMSSAAALSTSYMWLLFFCFVFWHLSNAAFVIAWSSGGKKIGAKEYFCISAVEHPYLLLIYCFCFPQDFFGARRRVLCRCPGLLTYAWQMSRRAYLFCVASYRTA